MGALTDLLKSERGLFALTLVIAATVLTALGDMTIDAWRDYSLYVFGIYATGKTLTGVAGLFTAAKREGDTDDDDDEPAETPALTETPAPAAASSK